MKKCKIKNVLIILLFLTISVCFCGKKRKTFKPIRLPATGQTKSYHKGDDGDLQKGVKWPKPRFVINRNGTITDRLTGLMWQRQPLNKPVNWFEAFKRIKRLNKKKLGGYSDWRMPNQDEIVSLINFNIINQSNWLKRIGFIIKKIRDRNPHIITDEILFWTYWFRSDHLKIVSVFKIRTNFIFGYPRDWKKRINGFALDVNYVLAVRTFEKGIIQLPTESKYKKILFSKKRFIDNGNDTITDRLTGLMWEQRPSKKKYTWEQAFKRIEKLNKLKLGGYSDWRLPNINELRSLLSFKIKNLNYNNKKGFNNFSGDSFWSSTNFENRYDKKIYEISSFSGNFYTVKKYSKSLTRVLAVRGANPPK